MPGSAGVEGNGLPHPEQSARHGNAGKVTLSRPMLTKWRHERTDRTQIEPPSPDCLRRAPSSVDAERASRALGQVPALTWRSGYTCWSE